MATGIRLFISYSRVDQAFAAKLAADLRARGFAVWIDQDAIPVGANWDVQIEKGVGQSDCVLLVLSPASVDSSWVRNEAILAGHEGKLIVPLLYQPCKVPINLIRRQHVDFTTDYEKGLERLVGDLSASLAARVDVPERGEVGLGARPLLSTGNSPSSGPVSSGFVSPAARRSVTLAVVVLIAIVLAAFFAVPDKLDEASGHGSGDKVPQSTPREGPPGTTTEAPDWTPGQPHARYPHVKAGLKKDQWVPEDGYAWLDSRGAGDFRVKWMPGVRHRQHPYVFTSQTEGRWSPAPGYTFVNPGDPSHLRVRPLSAQ